MSSSVATPWSPAWVPRAQLGQSNLRYGLGVRNHALEGGRHDHPRSTATRRATSTSTRACSASEPRGEGRQPGRPERLSTSSRSTAERPASTCNLLRVPARDARSTPRSPRLVHTTVWRADADRTRPTSGSSGLTRAHPRAPRAELAALRVIHLEGPFLSPERSGATPRPSTCARRTSTRCAAARRRSRHAGDARARPAGRRRAHRRAHAPRRPGLSRSQSRHHRAVARSADRHPPLHRVAPELREPPRSPIPTSRSSVIIDGQHVPDELLPRRVPACPRPASRSSRLRRPGASRPRPSARTAGSPASPSRAEAVRKPTRSAPARGAARRRDPAEPARARRPPTPSAPLLDARLEVQRVLVSP